VIDEEEGRDKGRDDLDDKIESRRFRPIEEMEGK
jgi:hypothetical protein